MQGPLASEPGISSLRCKLRGQRKATAVYRAGPQERSTEELYLVLVIGEVGPFWGGRGGVVRAAPRRCCTALPADLWLLTAWLECSPGRPSHPALFHF